MSTKMTGKGPPTPSVKEKDNKDQPDAVSKSSHSRRSSRSSNGSGSSGSSTYSDTPDYVLLEIRIKEQSEIIKSQNNTIEHLQEELDIERSEGLQLLKKLETSAKIAEKRVHDLSVELVKSREVAKRFQNAYEMELNARNQEKHSDPVLDVETKAQMRIHSLEQEAERLKEDIRSLNFECTQLRSNVRKADDERNAALKLYEASERDREEMRQRLQELQSSKKRQNEQLTLQTNDWLKKSKELQMMKEEMRWKMLDSSVSRRTDLGTKSQHRIPKDMYMPKRLQVLDQSGKESKKPGVNVKSRSKSSISAS